MNRILVEIMVPPVLRTFDVYISLESRMSDVLQMVVTVLNELSNGCYVGSRESVLCDADTGVIYDINARISDLGLRNGSQLLLV